MKNSSTFERSSFLSTLQSTSRKAGQLGSSRTGIHSHSLKIVFFFLSFSPFSVCLILLLFLLRYLDDNFLILLYNVRPPNLTSFFVARPCSDEMFVIETADINFIKGKWPMQLMAKVENVALDLPPKIISQAKNGKSFFAVENNDSDFSGLIRQIREHLVENGWISKYDEIMKSPEASRKNLLSTKGIVKEHMTFQREGGSTRTTSEAKERRASIVPKPDTPVLPRTPSHVPVLPKGETAKKPDDSTKVVLPATPQRRPEIISGPEEARKSVEAIEPPKPQQPSFGVVDHGPSPRLFDVSFKAHEHPKAPDQPKITIQLKIPAQPKAPEHHKALEHPKTQEQQRTPDQPRAVEHPKVPDQPKTPTPIKAPDQPKPTTHFFVNYRSGTPPAQDRSLKPVLPSLPVIGKSVSRPQLSVARTGDYSSALSTEPRVSFPLLQPLNAFPHLATNDHESSLRELLQEMKQAGLRVTEESLVSREVGNHVDAGTFGNVHLFEGNDNVIKVLNNKNNHSLLELRALW